MTTTGGDVVRGVRDVAFGPDHPGFLAGLGLETAPDDEDLEARATGPYDDQRAPPQVLLGPRHIGAPTPSFSPSSTRILSWWRPDRRSAIRDAGPPTSGAEQPLGGRRPWELMNS